MSRRRRVKLPVSWSSYAANMARRIGSGRHPFTAAGCWVGGGAPSCLTAGAAPPQIWRGNLAQVETLFCCWMLSRRRRAKLLDSWSSYASNMARRIGSGRNSFLAAGCWSGGGAPSCPTAGAATPQIWRGELAKVETHLQLLDVEQKEARQAAWQLEQLCLKYGEENWLR
jgi:hypothetical protein